MAEGYALSARHPGRLWFHTSAGFLLPLMPLSTRQKSLIAAAFGGTACVAIAFLLTHGQPTEKSGASATAPAGLSPHYHEETANPSLHPSSESIPLAHTPAKGRPSQPPPLPHSTAIQKSATTSTTATLIDRHDGPPSASITSTSTSTAPISTDSTTRPVHESTSPEASPSPPPLIVPFSADDPSTPATIPATLAASINGPTDTNTPSGAPPDPDAVVQHLASQFLNEIEGEGSDDPTHLAYQRRWLDAQVENDARLRASLGGHAWLELHQEAHQQALRDQSTESPDDQR